MPTSPTPSSTGFSKTETQHEDGAPEKEQRFYNSHTLKTKLPSAKSYTSNTYGYFRTCLRREETAVGEHTIETHMWSVLSLWTNSPYWPFQCFIKILFTFVAEVCVGEDPKILYINTERMCQNGRNSLCNRKADNPELQRERRTCKTTDAFGQKPPQYGENVQFKRKHGLVWTKPSDSQLVLLNYIKKKRPPML